MKICFVVPHAYPVVVPDAPGLFGGMETRAVTIARGLAGRGEHQIQFLVRNPQLSEPSLMDAITWIPWPDYWKDLRRDVLNHLEFSGRGRFRLRSWDWSLLWKIPWLALSNPFRRIPRDPRHLDRTITKIDCDLFCCFGNNQETATVLASAKRVGKPVVLFLGSDSDIAEEYISCHDYTNPTGQRSHVGGWVLKEATVVISQTSKQQSMLFQRFSRCSLVVPNPFDLDNWQEQMSHGSFDSPWGEHTYFLWIGRADPYFKRPDRLLEIARNVPEIPFLMILNPSDPRVEKEIIQAAPDHVKILSQVPYHVMPGVFDQAIALINTSALEGFPNTFLQAIASRVPIFSWEVGAEFLQSSRAGYCLDKDFTRTRELLLQASDHAYPPPYDPEFAEQELKARYSLSAVLDGLSSILRSLPIPSQAEG